MKSISHTKELITNVSYSLIFCFLSEYFLVSPEKFYLELDIDFPVIPFYFYPLIHRLSFLLYGICAYRVCSDQKCLNDANYKKGVYIIFFFSLLSAFSVPVLFFNLKLFFLTLLMILMTLIFSSVIVLYGFKNNKPAFFMSSVFFATNIYFFLFCISVIKNNVFG